MNNYDTDDYEMEFEIFQPWSTFVLATKMPPVILEKMIRFSDEIIKAKDEMGVSDSDALRGTFGSRGTQQLNSQYFIDYEVLEQNEDLTKYFLDMCKHYAVQAQCQAFPFDKERIVNEEWLTRIMGFWINSQKDDEYFPVHNHTDCAISAVMYLKIPEYLPVRRGPAGDNASYSNKDDGAITFSNNSSQDPFWGKPTMTIQPQVGDLFIFPSSQLHQVYPFKSLDGKGERRSAAFNAQFVSKTEQDIVNKRQNEQLEAMKSKQGTGVFHGSEYVWTANTDTT